MEEYVQFNENTHHTHTQRERQTLVVILGGKHQNSYSSMFDRTLNTTVQKSTYMEEHVQFNEYREREREREREGEREGERETNSRSNSWRKTSKFLLFDVPKFLLFDVRPYSRAKYCTVEYFYGRICARERQRDKLVNSNSWRKTSKFLLFDIRQYSK